MARLSEGARQLPLRRHLSIRVPWNDTGWTGTVANDRMGATDNRFV